MNLTKAKIIPDTKMIAKTIEIKLDEYLDGFNYCAEVDIDVELREDEIILSSSIKIDDVKSTYEENWTVNLEREDTMQPHLENICNQATLLIIKTLIEELVQTVYEKRA